MKQALIILSSLGLLVASFAYAKVDNTAFTAARKAENAQVKCEQVEANITRKISNFEKNRDKHLASYSKTKDRVTALVTKIEAEGNDVTKLRADLVEYDDKVKKFTDDFALYSSALEQAKSYACEQSEGDFKTQLQSSRTLLKTVHDDAVVIRTFWADVIKPDLLALKKQAQPEKEETENMTTGGTE